MYGEREIESVVALSRARCSDCETEMRSEREIVLWPYQGQDADGLRKEMKRNVGVTTAVPHHVMATTYLHPASRPIFVVP
jgi:hypothetical protein